MSPPNTEAMIQQQPVDAEMKPVEAGPGKADGKTDKPDTNMSVIETGQQVADDQPNPKPDDTASKPPETAVKRDAEMTTKPATPLEQHEATVTAIRAALLSELPPEQAAQEVLKAVTTHPDRDRLLASTLHRILPEVEFERALRLIDVSTHLDYATKNTISLIEALTKTMTADALSKSLPMLQPRIDAIKTKGKSDIYLIKLLRSFNSRDPHATNAVLAGRLKLLIASALPVWHRSGMNIRYQYNMHSLPPVPMPTDASLARALTAFMDGCRHPPGCERPSGWFPVRDGLRVLLDAFDVGELGEIQTRVCVQAMILFQHLEYDGGSFGKSLFAGGEGVMLRRRVWDRLDAGFKRFVGVLLQRERRWVRWKKTMEHAKEAKVEIGRVFKRRVIRKRDGISLGTENMGLTKPSWKTLIERSCNGGVGTLLEELKEDRKEAEEDRRKGDGKYVWRGLRSLCEENVEMMLKVADSDGKIDLERILEDG